MTTDRYPDFYVIGAPKCGTTALCHYLSQHSSIFIPELKEPHFFAFDLPAYRHIDSETAYHGLFSQARADQIRGEGSVWYLFSSEAVRRILEVRPDARFIIMLRNPADAAEALHAHHLILLGEDLQDFGEAWRAQERRAKGQDIPLHCPEPSQLQYRKVYGYAEQLTRLFAIVPKDQVKVVIFEEFFANPDAGYRDVHIFLGIQPESLPSFERVNVGRAPRRVLLQKFLSNPPLPLRPVLWGLAQLSHRFGLKLGLLSTWLMGVRPIDRTPMNLRLREELNRSFGPDIKAVEALLGRTIEAWGVTD